MTHVKHIFIICVLMIEISIISAETATCQYSQKRIKIHKNQFEEYTCELSVENPNNFVRVTDIDGDHDENSDNDVKFLIFNQNMKLQEFSAIFCEKFPNLEAIKIENVEIRSIDADSLQGCPNLKLLHLISNKIREIPEIFLSENLALVELVIIKNQLKTLAPDTLEMLENLKVLNLSSNKINVLPDRIFVALRNLENLNLDQNQLKNLNPEWFKELKNLNLLSINSNGIADLPQGVFSKLVNLELWSIKSNSLTVIHSDSFATRTKIKYIQVSSNQIDAIDPEFVQNSNLHGIYMTDNICFHTKSTNINIIKTVLRNCFTNYVSRSGNQPTSPPITTPTTTTTTTRQPTTRPTQSTITQIMPPEGQIVEKRFARGTYPWIAAILKQNDDYYCGGVLVSDKKIVTTARCVHKYERKRFTQMNPREIKVVLGSHDLTNSLEHGRIVSAIAAIKIHPNFDISLTTNGFDIAVIELAVPVATSKYVKSINLMDENSEPEEIRDGIVASYGYRDNRKLTSKSAPKQLDMIFLDGYNCLLEYKVMAYASGEKTFCISEKSIVRVCAEDIGSGLFVKYGTKFYLRGIVSSVVSTDVESCDKKTFSIYTDVLQYTDWIRSIPETRIQNTVSNNRGPVWP